MTPSDRYEPLPGLAGMPGYLVRKIPPRARRPAAWAAIVLLAVTAVALAVAIPSITETKAERAASQAQQDRERREQRTAELQAEIRLREGRGTPARGLEGAAAIEARRALASDLTAAVREDALERQERGELTQSVDRVQCERYPRGARGEDPATDLSSPTGRYSCLAVTADAPRTETQNPSVIGYPYRAMVDFETGRFAFCKVSGRPGEGGIRRELLVRVPEACGGGA